MRNMATIAALLLCLLAPASCSDSEAKAEQEAGANGDEVKVLGFTLGEPPPEEAVLRILAGRYRRYDLKHRWCESLWATTDNGRVVSVACTPNDPDNMLTLLKSRYGPPQERGGSSAWFTPYGTAIINGLRRDAPLPHMVVWVRATTWDELRAKGKEEARSARAISHAIDAAIAEQLGAEGEDF